MRLCIEKRVWGYFISNQLALTDRSHENSRHEKVVVALASARYPLLEEGNRNLTWRAATYNLLTKMNWLRERTCGVLIILDRAEAIEAPMFKNWQPSGD